MNRALGRLAAATPVIVRLIVGGMMFVHGLEKLTDGPAGFGQFLEQLEVPAPALMAWLVTLLELVGGALLVVGFLSRLVALLMTIELSTAIALVTWSNGLIAVEGVGFERDLAYITGFITVLLLGPGRPSLDHAMGLEEAVPRLAVGPRGTAGGARTARSTQG
jgi:putative oxidoreductase